jgi:dTDP-4-amino-4,6-dideoxygalactose transaminase
MEELSRIAADHDLLLVDDAAQSLGASSRTGMAGTLGDFGIISFGPGKIGPGIGGGCLLTDREDIYQRLPDPSPPPGFLEELGGVTRMLFEKRVRKVTAPYRHLKRRGPRGLAKKQKPPGNIAVQGIGVVQARSCLAILQDVEDELAARKRIVACLGEELSGLDAELPMDCEGRVWRGYPVRLLEKHRYDVCSELSRRYVETFAPYPPLHMQNSYREYSQIVSGKGFPGSEEAFRRLVTIPIHRGIGPDQMELLADALRSVIGLKK